MGSAMSDESDQTRPSVSALTGLDIGGFGREVQAAFLVDQLIVALKLTEIDIQYAELSRIDGDLQSFLSILMTQQDGTRGVYCGSIAMSIRYESAVCNVQSLMSNFQGPCLLYTCICCAYQPKREI